MKRAFVFFAGAWLLAGVGQGQVYAQEPDPGFAVENIPGSLVENANAVMRYSFTRVEINSPADMNYRVKKAVTVLNRQGEDAGVAYVLYDESRKIRELNARIYDASGKLMRAVKEKDFTDQSAVSNISIYEDTRVKYYHPEVRQYPYTVFYEYEVKNRNTHYFPAWAPVESPLVSVSKAIYEVACGDGFEIRIKEMNMPSGVSVESREEMKVYRWEMKNVPAFREEPFSPPFRTHMPYVMVAPVDFEYAGIKGKFSTWEQYGTWVYANLLEGRGQVPDETAAKIRELVSDAKDAREKVKRIYRYVQQKNRYVSIQVGIGGLQPMTAENVDRLSYGDCKALVNYTKALLAAAGIPSIYTEVFAGKEQRSYFPRFASFLQGNHIILCVPLQCDTVWLECTSREAPFNYLGTFTDNRNVLLITEDGGIITRTPAVENSESLRKAEFTILENGDLHAEVETNLTGIFYNERYELLHATGREADEILKELYPVNNLYIEEWNVSQQKEGPPRTLEKLHLQARDFVNFSSDRLFLPLNPLNRVENIPREPGERKTAVFVRESYREEDTYRFLLPAAYKTEYLPDDLEIDKPFGHFSLSVEKEGNEIIYKRIFRLKKGEYPPGTCKELTGFLRQVQRADLQKAVLVLR